jgi:hypothetical protein
VSHGQTREGLPRIDGEQATPAQKENVMRVATPISFAGSQLSESRHVCAFFNSDDEQYRVLLPFIKDGFECGDKFESRVNDVWCRHDDAVICVYNLAKFGADTVIDIMRTHPMIIIGGILQHNPFFVAPNVFLHELRERRAGRSTSPPTAT